jgi:predicted AAA+ superfamily ATPase
MEETIEREIFRQNPWWRTSSVEFEIEVKEREQFTKILNWLGKRQIISVYGLRRSGKTILMNQIIDYLLKKKTNPKNIFYFSFEEIFVKSPEILKDIIDFYLNNILKGNERIYIFLDEVQYVPNWSSYLKFYYDLNPKMKFFVSGSASLFIKRRVTESLAGRIIDFELDTLSFKEFLRFKGLKIDEVIKNKELFKFDVQKYFIEYLLKGGFPEVAGENNLDFIHTYVKNSVLERLLYRDIKQIFRVREPGSLLEMLKYLSSSTSGQVSMEKLASNLSITRQTVKNYLYYLKESLIIDFLYLYKKSVIASLRKAKKVYFKDVGIVNALLGNAEEILTQDFCGNLVENIVFNHLRKKYEKIFFWKDKSGNEVDFIIDDKGKILPIEVKFKKKVEKNEIKGLLKFCKIFKIKKAIVVTKNENVRKMLDDENVEVDFVPVWLFLLTL